MSSVFYFVTSVCFFVELFPNKSMQDFPPFFPSKHIRFRDIFPYFSSVPMQDLVQGVQVDQLSKKASILLFHVVLENN